MSTQPGPPMATDLSVKAPFALLLAALCCLAGGVALRAQTTAFTYQGRLTDNGAPANGIFDLRFRPHAAATGNSPAGDPITLLAVGVTNGVFTVLLNFGAEIFTGADRWLDIAVRPTGSATFTTLSPRQPITATPYALTALTAKQVSGVSGHALHAADGSPQNAVFVDGAGKVGVGTVNPASRLHVASSAGESLPPRLQSSGSDRYNAGWDFYHGATGKGYVGVPDAAAAFAPGEMLVFGGPGTKVSLWPGGMRSLTADPSGNVGIGTTNPAARLHVQGEVRLGPGGKLRATGGDEGLRILRGVIDSEGGVVSGAGFTCTRLATGTYRIQFDDGFSFNSVPVAIANVSVTGTDTTPVVAMFSNTITDRVDIFLRRGSDGVLVNRYFNFMIIGQPE